MHQAQFAGDGLGQFIARHLQAEESTCPARKARCHQIQRFGQLALHQRQALIALALQEKPGQQAQQGTQGMATTMGWRSMTAASTPNANSIAQPSSRPDTVHSRPDCTITRSSW